MAPDNFELLRYLHEEQRDQLNYRRSREFQIFTWSAALLLAAIGILIVKEPDKDIVILKGFYARLLGSAVILGVGIFSAVWQNFQRQRAAEHQRVLVRLAEELGCFDKISPEGEPLYPLRWKSWGTRYTTFLEQLGRPSKVSATLALALIAFLSLWLDLFF